MRGSWVVLADQWPFFVFEVDRSFCGKAVVLFSVFDALDSLLVMCQHIVQRSSWQIGVLYVGVGKLFMSIKYLSHDLDLHYKVDIMILFMIGVSVGQ